MGKVTQELLQEFIRLYEEGKSTVDLQKMFNIDRSTITYHFKKHGIKTRSVRKVDIKDITSQEGTPEFYYFIGILASDGCISNNTVSLEFAENNSEILSHWNNFLGNKCNINTHYNKNTDKNYYRISFMNKEICNLLFKYGITPNKSLTIQLSEINWDIIRGLFDGDGSLVFDTRNLSAKFKISSGSKRLLEQIQEFFNTNNIKSTIYNKDNKGNNCMDLVVGQLENIFKVYNNMYKNASYFLKRKHEKFGPIVKKFTIDNSVNSGNEGCASNPEPSLIEEGAETRHGEPKLE